MSDLNISTEEVLSFFPIIDLPITLTAESVHDFSTVNKPLNAIATQWLLDVCGENNEDEMTEFIPCLQLDIQDDFYAIIFWKGALLKYEYILCTISKKGTLLSKKSIGGTIIKDETITTSVAMIDEELIIHIMVGANEAQRTDYNPEQSQPMTLEILTTGDIIFSLNEELF